MSRFKLETTQFVQAGLEERFAGKLAAMTSPLQRQARAGSMRPPRRLRRVRVPLIADSIPGDRGHRGWVPEGLEMREKRAEFQEVIEQRRVDRRRELKNPTIAH